MRCSYFVRCHSRARWLVYRPVGDPAPSAHRAAGARWLLCDDHMRRRINSETAQTKPRIRPLFLREVMAEPVPTPG